MTTAHHGAARRLGPLIAGIGVGLVVLLWWGGALIASLYLFTSGCEDAGVGCRAAHPGTAWAELGIAAAGGAVGGALLSELLQVTGRDTMRRGRVVLLAVTMAAALAGWWVVVRAHR